MKTKFCPHCKQDKPLSAFYPSKTQSGGYRVYCRTCQIEINRLAVARDPLKKKRQVRKSNQKAKGIVLAHYGNGKLACVICGEDRIACLSLDHIDGNGAEERAKLSPLGKGGVPFYRWLRKNNYPKGYQTLCMNCQWIKRDKDKEFGNQFS